MEWPDSIDAKLPPKHQDEPASLRQDIKDEIQDHLICSLRHELTKNADVDLAVKHVASRFGDPSALVARLWLDSMKGRIMRQRVVVGIACVSVFMAAVAMLLTWSLATKIQGSQEALQAITAESLARLEQAIATQGTASQKSSYGRLAIKVVQDNASATPQPGVGVTVIGRLYREPEAYTMVTNEAGLADFGLVQPGQYSLELTVPGDVTLKNAVGQLVRIGDDSVAIARIPHIDVASINFDVAWPDDVQLNPLGALITIYNEHLNGWSSPILTLMVTSEGEVMHLSAPLGDKLNWQAGSTVTGISAGSHGTKAIGTEGVVRLPAGRIRVSTPILVVYQVDDNGKMRFRSLGGLTDEPDQAQLLPKGDTEHVVSAGTNRIPLAVRLSEFDRQQIFAIQAVNAAVPQLSMFAEDLSRSFAETFLSFDVDRDQALSKSELDAFTDQGWQLALPGSHMQQLPVVVKKPLIDWFEQAADDISLNAFLDELARLTNRSSHGE